MIEKEKVINKLKLLKIKDKKNPKACKEFNSAGLNHCLVILEHILINKSINYDNLVHTLMYPRSEKCIKKDIANLIEADIISRTVNDEFKINENYLRKA